MVAWHWHSVGAACGHGTVGVVRLGTQRLGHGRGGALSLRYAVELCGIHGVSCSVGMVAMEGAAAAVGSCCHLLAHCWLLLAHNAHRSA